RRRSVCAGARGLPAGPAASSLDVNVEDARVWVWAAQHLGVEHMRHLHVADVQGGAGDLLAGSDLRNVHADQWLRHPGPLDDVSYFTAATASLSPLTSGQARPDPSTMTMAAPWDASYV